jgi:hypothetical protein
MKNNFDCLVIGKGPLGILTSYKLLEKGKKVLNIDSGLGLNLLQDKMTLESNISWLDLEQKPSFNKKASDYMWLGACMGWPSNYFEDGSFEEKNIPLSIAEIKDSYKNIAEILKLSEFDFIKNIPNNKEKTLKYHEFSHIFAKVTKNLYLNNLTSYIENNKNYQFMDNLIANKIMPIKNKLVVEIIQYPGLNISKFQANNVFLCLGSVENTRLLLQSKENIDLNLEYLGKNLTDHISFPFAKINTENIANIKNLFESKEDSPTSNLWPRITYNNDSPHSFCYVDRFHKRKYTNNFFLKSLIKHDGNAYLNLFIEKEASVDTSLSLTPDSSSLLINFFINNNEFESMIKLSDRYAEYFNESIEGIKISKINYDFSSIDKFTSTNHPSGTTKMSREPSKGVVDKYSRIWNQNNIFVYGSSVLPMASYIHPTFTSMALANYSLKNI